MHTCARGWCNNTQGGVAFGSCITPPRVFLHHPSHTVQGKCGLIVLFLAKVTFQPSWCIEIYTINGSHASTFKHIKFVWWLNCSDSFRLVSLVSNFETAKASQNKSPNKSTWIKAIKLCNIHYIYVCNMQYTLQWLKIMWSELNNQY